jgi:NADPH:quinone reductase-like Zn-dependent oxidoreductase
VKAIIHDRYGPPDVLRVAERARPVPEADELLVRVCATTVNQTDCHMRRARPVFWRFILGIRRPRSGVLGSEFAGGVAAVGAAVRNFAPGDRVFGIHRGTHAEYICVRQSAAVSRMPGEMSFEEAAAVPDSFAQGIRIMRAINVAPGMRLLVYGASGSCGTACVQLARHFGAHVTAVCNGKNVDLVRSLGADEVIDYESQDYIRAGQTYQVVIDAVNKTSYRHARRVLRKGGVYVPTDLGSLWENLPLGLWTRFFSDRTFVSASIGALKREDLMLLRQLIEAGEYRAVIDGVYPMEEAVQAHRRVDSWQKTGSVVLRIVESGGDGPSGEISDTAVTSPDG